MIRLAPLTPNGPPEADASDHMHSTSGYKVQLLAPAQTLSHLSGLTPHT